MPGRRETADVAPEATEVRSGAPEATEISRGAPEAAQVSRAPEATEVSSGAPGATAIGRAPDTTGSQAPHEDRWRWRRRIRANPVQLRLYRGVVGVVGLLLIVLGLVTGPIPGPGGIPLVLLGLAAWASEFAWAHRLMAVFKAQLHRFQSWTRWQQAAFWVVFFSFCGLCGYASMLVLGIPGWVPPSGDALLQRLPGL